MNIKNTLFPCEIHWEEEKKYSVGYSHTDKQTNSSHSSLPIEREQEHIFSKYS